MINSFSELVDTLGNYSILEYLDKMGIQHNKNKLICLNPDHKEKTPSMSIKDIGSHGTDKPYVHCFACHFSGDIFKLHSLSLGLDCSNSQDFVDIVKDLADKLEINYNMEPPTPEELKRQSFYRVYSYLFNKLRSVFDKNTPEDIKGYCKERGWASDVDFLPLGVGWLTETDLEETLAAFPSEVDSSFSNEDDFWRLKALFGKGIDKCLVTTYFDQRKRPVGFALRNVAWTEDSSIKKWRNTDGLVPIFDKRSLLYNLPEAKSYLKQASEKVFVFEGQSSCLTSYLNGFGGAVGLGTSICTEEQAYLLKTLNATKYILCLDPDNAGQKGTAHFIKTFSTILGGHRIYVKNYSPLGGLDPDEFIRENSFTEFDEKEDVPAFSWLYEYLTEEKDLRDVLSDLIYLISTFKHAIEREDFCKQLSLSTGYTLQTLLDEVNTIINAKENHYKDKVRDLAGEVFSQIKKDPDSAIRYLDDLRDKVEIVQGEKGNTTATSAYFLDQIMKFQGEAESFEEGFPGFRLPLLPGLQDAINNDWSKGKMLCVGGEENAGKSSLSCFFCYNLALPEAENDIKVMYMTIDDSVPELLPKYIAMAGRHQTRGYNGWENGFPLEINHITRPKYWAKHLRDINPKLEEDMIHAYRVGHNFIKDLVKQERLLLFGVPDCLDLNDFERAIARVRKEDPDTNIFAYLDNIHKLPLIGDARLGFKDISNRMKTLSIKYNIATGGTLEYNSDSSKRQGDMRPTNASLAESRAFKYDASFILHVYNHRHVYGDQSNWYHEVPKLGLPGINKFPVIEAIIGKNKISGDKSTHALLFHPASSWFEEVDLGQIAAVVESRDISAKEGGKPTIRGTSLSDVGPVVSRPSLAQGWGLEEDE